MNKILFLNENPVPKIFTTGTISAKELRLRSAIEEIDEIEILTFPGLSVTGRDNSIGKLEKKIHVRVLPSWPYYMRTIPLLLYGSISILKNRPMTIEAESPIISGIGAVLLGKFFQIPSIIEVRSTFHELVRFRFKFIPLRLKQGLVELVYKFVLKSADVVITNSHFYARQMEKYGVCAYEINPGLQYPNKKINLKKNKKLIGFIGRLVKEKNVDCLIRAVAIVKEKIPKIELQIAGDGVCRQELMDLVKNLRLEESVRFLGMVSASETIPEWQLSVNPISVLVPLEMANVEAAYYGVPVICYGNDEYPETVVDGITGWKLKGEIEETKLAKKIVEVLGNPNLIKKVSKQAQDFACKNYSFEKQISNLRYLYKDIEVI